MKNIDKAKPVLSIFLSIIIILASIPLSAADPQGIVISNTEHKQIIEQFLSEITAIQGQVFDIAQAALTTNVQVDGRLAVRINLINTNIEGLNKRIQDYLASIPEVSERNRHVLLTFNVLNLVKSSLYTLSLLIRSTNDAERLVLLDEYFNTRVTALDTLQILEEILQKYNA